MVKATLSNYRQSPRKVRLVADVVRGKKADQALISLDFITKRTAEPMKKLILSALANAKNVLNADKEDLYIKEIRVDEGAILKRIMPRARGRAGRINKRTSHVMLTLDLVANKKQTKTRSIKPATPKKEVAVK